MTYEEFDDIVDRLHKLEKEICATKGKEYSNSEDRLANFKRVGTELAISPLSVAYVYLKKHLDSISFATKNDEVISESFESRILDARTYLALLYALYIEIKREKRTENPFTGNKF